MANDEMVELQNTSALNELQDLVAQDALIDPELEAQADAEQNVAIPTLEESQASHNPEDVAAAFFKRSEAGFPLEVKNLSLNACHRVILNFAFGGLSEKEYKLVSDAERRVAYRLEEIATQRFIMKMAAEMDHAEKQMLRDEENRKQQEVSTTETKEV